MPITSQIPSITCTPGLNNTDCHNMAYGKSIPGGANNGNNVTNNEQKKDNNATVTLNNEQKKDNNATVALNNE
ncbi:hypothetical protein ACRRVA_03420 [Candidatus Cardinium hertigii]|uniref:hypothetical protein n=1 Tax=Candidatus Cardinium hertigii TaxID=247481 RepID=UPI003D7D8347